MNEYIICGETEIRSNKIKEVYDQLCQVVEGEEEKEEGGGDPRETGFERQYQVRKRERKAHYNYCQRILSSSY